MIKRLLRYVTFTLLLATLTLAAQRSQAQGWDYDLGIYLWALGMDGTMTVRGQEAPVDVGFSDIVDNLEMAFSTHFEANKRESN